MLLNRKYNFISTTMTQITNWHLKSIIIFFRKSAYVSQSGSLQDVRWFSPPETFWTLVFEAFQILFVLLVVQLGGHRRSDLDVTGRTKLLQHWSFPRILVSKPGILPRVMSWTKTASSFSDGRLQPESELIEHIVVGYLADRPPESDISSTPAKKKLLQDIYKRWLYICCLSEVKLS